MMSIVEVRIRREPDGGLLLLWIPLFFLWVLLLPAALVLSPFLLIACVAANLGPLRALSALVRVGAALRGTQVALQDRRHSVLINVSEGE